MSMMNWAIVHFSCDVMSDISKYAEIQANIKSITKHLICSIQIHTSQSLVIILLNKMGSSEPVETFFEILLVATNIDAYRRTLYMSDVYSKL